MRYPLVDGQGNFGCFTGDTEIRLLDGTTKSFEELSHRGPDGRFHVYSVDGAGRIVVGEGRNARITKKGAALVEVELDSGARIRCTPDHRFLLRDNTYKQAMDLAPDDHLFAGYFDSAPVKTGMNDYLRVLQPQTGSYEFVHHLADEFNAQHGNAAPTKGAFVRHHKNFDRWDNRPENIVRMSFLEHLHLHAEHLSELWRDPVFRARQRAGVVRYDADTPAAREARARACRARNQDPAFRSANGERVGAALKRRHAAHPELGREISTRMSALWASPSYRSKMSEALTGIEKRPLSTGAAQGGRPDHFRAQPRNVADPVKRHEIQRAILASLRILRSADRLARIPAGPGGTPPIALATPPTITPRSRELSGAGRVFARCTRTRSRGSGLKSRSGGAARWRSCEQRPADGRES